MKTRQTKRNNRNRQAGWKIGLAFLGVLAIAEMAPAWAQTPALTTDHFSYLPAEPITALFKGGPGNPKDWVGIYPKGVEPGSVGSTIWLYTDGTTAGSKGFVEGTVTFANGLSLAGDWTAFLLANDGYAKLAQIDLKVVDPALAFVRPNKRDYTAGEPISVVFTNGPGNAKDWIGIYPKDRLPGNGNSLLWNYVDGTQSGATARTEGAVNFSGGLGNGGDYIAYLLENDGYTVLASEAFTVTQTAADALRLVSISPPNNASNVPPFVEMTAIVRNGTQKMATNTVTLTLDGAAVAPAVAPQGDATFITYTNPSALAPNSIHVFVLRYSDDAGRPNWFTNQTSFATTTYTNIILPSPIYFEDFDSTAEGKLPAGWTSISFSDATDENYDLQDLNSKSYADWVVVSRNRFTNSFLSYDSHQSTDDYQRVLTVNPLNIVDGKLVRDLASGNFIFADSGYRSGANQYLILLTPDFDLRGKTNVHLSYHSLWEQNQDSFASVEYSIDKGSHWLPIVYMLDSADVIKTDTGEIDAVATFTADHGDVAHYIDPATGEDRGSAYWPFIGATVGPELAPFIGGRINDDPMESKRVEIFRLPKADNQQTVRFRFAHAGTDSWYFGIDNFGLYSMAPAPETPVALALLRVGNELEISWPASATGYELESSDSASLPQWTKVTGVAGNLARVPLSTREKYYRLRK